MQHLQIISGKKNNVKEKDLDEIKCNLDKDKSLQNLKPYYSLSMDVGFSLKRN